MVTVIQGLGERYGLHLPGPVVGSLIFFGVILIFQVVYYLMVTLEARALRVDKKLLLPLLGYGFIPLILGGYLAVHLEFFVRDSWNLVLIVQEALKLLPVATGDIRLISRDSTAVLQTLTVIGGLLASMYATYRIVNRVLAGDTLESRMVVLPFGFLITMAVLFIVML